MSTTAAMSDPISERTHVVVLSDNERVAVMWTDDNGNDLKLIGNFNDVRRALASALAQVGAKDPRVRAWREREGYEPSVEKAIAEQEAATTPSEVWAQAEAADAQPEQAIREEWGDEMADFVKGDTDDDANPGEPF